MEMTGFFSLLWWALGGAAVLGAVVYLYMEYQAYMLRTSVVSVPGGLRFEAQGLTVESRHSAKELKITSRSGRYTRQPLAGGDPEVQTGALAVTLPAIGLQIEVSRISVKGEEGKAATATGFSRIVFAATDEPLQKAMGRTGAAIPAVVICRIISVRRFDSSQSNQLAGARVQVPLINPAKAAQEMTRTRFLQLRVIFLERPLERS